MESHSYTIDGTSIIEVCMANFHFFFNMLKCFKNTFFWNWIVVFFFQIFDENKNVKEKKNEFSISSKFKKFTENRVKKMLENKSKVN